MILTIFRIDKRMLQDLTNLMKNLPGGACILKAEVASTSNEVQLELHVASMSDLNKVLKYAI